MPLDIMYALTALIVLGIIGASCVAAIWGTIDFIAWVIRRHKEERIRQAKLASAKLLADWYRQQEAK